MKIIFLFVCLIIFCRAETYQDYKNYLIKYEGYSNYPYVDLTGMAVGVGHNLSSHNQQIRKYSDEEIDTFFANDLSEALICANYYIYNFESQPIKVKFVTISLIWSCGPIGFKRFKNYIIAVNNKQYVKAAESLFYSNWFHQVSQLRAYESYADLESCAYEKTIKK